MLIRVKAENTSSGNPQRGWVHVDSTGNFIGFIDEGYNGDAAIKPLRDKGEAETIPLTISNKQYKELYKRSDEGKSSGHWFYR